MNTRRRMISIAAACTAAAPLAAARAAAAAKGVSAAAMPDVPSTVWRGTVMGALASMTLLHPRREIAQAAIADCLVEIDRLESILSLYRPDSALCRLNAAGSLDAPPQELVELLSSALDLSRASGGAFDVTVQPLYRLYAEHFARAGASAGGPPASAIAAALRLVDGRGVEVDGGRIRFARPGMAVTLNGIAQGFITDRIAERLQAAGFDDLLIDLGEVRALGQRPGGGAWRAALADPRAARRTLLELPLGDGPSVRSALATSAGSGSSFSTDPRIHHLFDPRTGRSANHYLSVSVAAPRATLADGLSTAVSVLAPQRLDALLAHYPSVRVYLLDAAGQLQLARSH